MHGEEICKFKQRSMQSFTIVHCVVEILLCVRCLAGRMAMHACQIGPTTPLPGIATTGLHRDKLLCVKEGITSVHVSDGNYR